MKKLLLHVLLMIPAITLSAEREVISSFNANGKSYEVYVGYGDMMYVTYANNIDTNFVKAPGCDGGYKKYGSCKSVSEMLSEIQSKVSNKSY